MTNFVGTKQAATDIRRTILVTGASGGIGRATALAVADQCDRMIIHGNRRVEELNSLAKELKDRGIAVDILKYDLSMEFEQNNLIESVLRRHHENDRLVATIYAAGVDLMALDERDRTGDEKLKQILAVDVGATARIARRLGLFMKGQTDYYSSRMGEKTSTPVCIFFGWSGIDRGMPGETAELYALAKGAVTAFSKSLAQSLAPSVRCVTVAPGWIRTAWGQQASPDFQRLATDDSLAGRWGTPDDVAKVVRFLLSEDSHFINADVIPVTGGYRSRSVKKRAKALW
ncbi:MAG: SDR family oxidoreductase [Planctomycetia bacterium]|nr:SDR family oxidoreductase [Planctomycetia bacterium]